MSNTPSSTDHALDPAAKQTDQLQRRGPAGDARPNDQDPDPRTRGGKPQEDVEDRPVVSTVTPEDYPAKDRADSRPLTGRAPMDVSETPVIERIARVLAAQRISANAKGVQPSAAPDVDDAWPDYRSDAVAVLKTLREPDRTMAEAGDPAVWERMILAALARE